MDPTLLAYLTAQQMVSQQLGFPLLQAGAVPMTVQASSLFQPAVSTAQLLGMGHYFKPAALPTAVSQQELLLQLLNNNGLNAMMTPLAPAPVVEKPPPTPPQAFLSLFEQLVAANSLQHPLFVDHASTLAALTVQAPQQQQTLAKTPLITYPPAPATVLQAALQPTPTTTPTVYSAQPITVLQAPPQPTTIYLDQQAPTVLKAVPLTPTTTTTTVYAQPITVLQAPPTITTVAAPTVHRQQQQQQATVLRPAPRSSSAFGPVTSSIGTVPTQYKPTVPVASALPVIRIDSPEKPRASSWITTEKTPALSGAFRVVKPAAAAGTVIRQTTVAPPQAPPAAKLPPPPQQQQPAPIKQEVCSPVKSSPSQLSVDSAIVTSSSSSLGPATVPSGAATVYASTSKSSSIDEEMELSGDEEERCRPEDVFAGRQRRADHIAFHRKMKSLLKGLRGADLICKVCAVKVERHDNAFKAHIAEHAAAGANQLECRYCGYETPSRVEMNLHMGDRHPHGSERAYTDKRDHLKMIEIMNQCFAKVPRPPKPQLPASGKRKPVKPRKPRKKRSVADAEDTVAPTVSSIPATVSEESAGESFEHIIVRFCTETPTTEVTCACGDDVPLNPSALLQHVKTLHAQYRCDDCGDVLECTDAARVHTVRMHGGDEHTFAQRIVDHLMVRSVHQRFMACFMRKDGDKVGAARLAKSYSVRVLQDELTERSKIKEEIKKEIKEEPADA